MSDALSDESRLRVLTGIDHFARECITIEAERSFPSKAVTKILDTVINRRGKPKIIFVSFRSLDGQNRQFGFQPLPIH